MGPMRGALLAMAPTLAAVVALAACAGQAEPSRPSASPSIGPSPSIAASTQPTTVSQRPDPFAELAARALQPPPIPWGGCPVAPVAEIDPRIAPASGTGPIYPVLGANAGRFSIADAPVAEFGRYQMKTLWVSTDPADELILIRVLRTDGQPPAPGFTGGSASARDSEGMPTQLRLGPDASLSFGGGPMPEGWRAWSSGTLVADAGCYAFQIDTPRGTETLVFEVVE